MRNKMKFWRRVGAAIKQAMINKGIHERGRRYGRAARVVPTPPVWRGGPPSVVAPSPLLSGLLGLLGLLKRQA